MSAWRVEAREGIHGRSGTWSSVTTVPEPLLHSLGTLQTSGRLVNGLGAVSLQDRAGSSLSPDRLILAPF